MRILLILVCAATADSQAPMSLQEAVRTALDHNKSLQAAGAAADAAKAKIAEARAGFLPSVDYAESWARSDNPVFVFSSLLTQHQFTTQNFDIGTLNRPDFLNNFQSQITVNQPVYDAGRTRRAVRAAELGSSAAAEDSRRTELDVIAGVVRSYFDAQLSAELLKAANQAEKSAQSDLQRAQSRVEAGMTTDVDVLSVRVQLSAVREQQIRRAAGLEVAQAALNDALGLGLDTPHTLATPLAALEIPVLALPEYESSAAANRPEAHEAKLATDLANVQVRDVRGSLLPQVVAHGAFEADRQRFYDRGGDNWLVSIGLRWNLFRGFGDKARIAEANAAVRRSEAQRDRADSAIRLEVRRAYADLKAAHQRIQVAQSSVAEAQESLRISQNRYEAGLSTITDLLRTETALLESQVRFMGAVHDQRIAAAMLEAAAGKLDADSEVLH